MSISPPSSPGEHAIALAEKVQKDPRLVEVILGQSRRVLRHRPGVLIVEHKLGFVVANAGVDQSNVDPAKGAQPVLLLPEDPDASALRLHEQIRQRLGKTVAVVINDSFGRAWRLGTVGVALGAAGLPALIDLRGMPGPLWPPAASQRNRLRRRDRGRGLVVDGAGERSNAGGRTARPSVARS